ncbi:hypothetical protein [Mycobacterium sp. 48b]|uniref:hypothetical protein n=1 Tax=Mycobacterium sp. 48b TaxID=3400426 RepID=UPI003AAB094D
MIIVGAGTGAPGIANGTDRWALNGTFRAESNGQWAKTNDRFHDEQVVVATWTISSSCSAPTACSGEVHSNQGWSAPVYQSSGTWNVKRTVPGWESCQSGAAVDGLQHIRFYAVNDEGTLDIHSSTFAGFDKTTAPSGGCGINKGLTIVMPFKLTPIDGS